jgi:hypothetical protein
LMQRTQGSFGVACTVALRPCSFFRCSAVSTQPSMHQVDLSIFHCPLVSVCLGLLTQVHLSCSAP